MDVMDECFPLNVAAAVGCLAWIAIAACALVRLAVGL